MSMLVAVILGLVGVALIIAGATNSAPNILGVITGTGAGAAGAPAKVTGPVTAANLPTPFGGLF